MEITITIFNLLLHTLHSVNSPLFMRDEGVRFLKTHRRSGAEGFLLKMKGVIHIGGLSIERGVNTAFQ